MMLGDFSTDIAYAPIRGSDRLTVGLTPSTMHANPGIDPSAAVAMPASVAAVPAAASSSSLIWIAILAFAAWYAWKKGWLAV
jgi:hypothetical protein